MARLTRVGVLTVVAAVVVAARGGFAVVRKRRRACIFAANVGGSTIRLHATLPTAVGFTIVAKLAKLGVHTATSVDKRFGVVPV